MSFRTIFNRFDREVIGTNRSEILSVRQSGDYVYGLAGNDFFQMRDGLNGTFSGGSGNDSYSYSHSAITYISEKGNSIEDLFAFRNDIIYDQIKFFEIDDKHLVILFEYSSFNSTVIFYDWKMQSNQIEFWDLGQGTLLNFEQFRSSVFSSSDYLGSINSIDAFGPQGSSDFERILTQLSLNERDYEIGAATLPFLEINSPLLIEGDSGSAALSFTISLSAPAPQDVTFRLISVDGTATAGEDYNSVDRNITISAGQLSISVSVDVRGDISREGDETFLLAAIDVVGARAPFGFPFAFGTGAIADNETGSLPVITVSSINVTEQEGSFARFTVSLSEAAPRDISFTASTKSVTALAGVDFTSIDQVFVISKGSRTITIDIPVLADAIPESDEVFEFVLSQPKGAIFSGGTTSISGRATVQDNDRPGLPNDPLFLQQYYLLNTGQSGGTPGADINFIPLAGEFTGLGVDVFVADDGVDYTNRDLAAAVDRSTDRAVTPPVDDAFPIRPGDAHGTFVAGIIGARSNDGFGIAGVAPGSQLHAFRLDFASGRFRDELASSFLEASGYDVANYSLSFNVPFIDSVFDPGTAPMFEALLTAAGVGRNGLGTVVVFAAGNSFDGGSDVNLYGLQSSINVVTVAALDRNGTYASVVDDAGYSTAGAAILVSAPGTQIVSTDITGSFGYESGDHATNSGTSFAAPMVAGVVALMLEANPNLGFRDVQQILAITARQNDRDDLDWRFNGATNFNGGAAHFNTNYGFGAVDAHAAVRLAESWTLPPKTLSNRLLNTLPISGGIIDAGGSVFTVIVTDPLELEHVRVQLDFTYSRFRDIQITLISPSGTESDLLFRPTNGNLTSVEGNIQLTSVHFQGENPVGEWQLEIRDAGLNPAADDGFLKSAALVLVGAPENPDDIYVYTDEFSTLALKSTDRTSIDDPDGDTTINFAAMTSSNVINLDAGTATLGATSITISSRTTVTHVIAGDGNDQLIGGSKAEALDGGRGNDLLVGGAGDDILKGGPGSDQLFGGVGSDTLDGGTGFDIAYYNFDAISSGIQISMISGLVVGEGGTDTLVGIEAVWGTVFGDIFLGSDEDNFFVGDGGNDVAEGGGGIDAFQINNNFSDNAISFDGEYFIISSNQFGLDKIKNFETFIFSGNSTIVKSAAELLTFIQPSDTAPPSVASFAPIDGDANVTTTSNIVVNFSEAIARGTGTIEIRAGSASGTVVEAFDAATSARITVSGSQLTIDPTNNLANGTTYFVVFAPGTVRDLAGNPFAGTSSYDFTTAAAADTTPPSVTSLSPTDGAANVAVGANITVGFTETIQRGTGTIEIRSDSASGPMVETLDAATSARISITGSTVTIDPTSDLANGTTYFVVFAPGSVRDLAGNSFAGTNTYDFTTAPPVDSTPPLVTSLSPTDGASSVSVGANINVSFSENIQRGSGTIEIRSGSASGPAVEAFDAATSARITASGSQLTIDPTSNLANGTTYFVVFAPGTVRDLAGNPFAGTSAYDFTTASSTPLNDAPMVANAIADQSSAEDAAWSYTVPANAFSDVDSATLTYTATLGDGSALPSWLTFTPATRTFSGTPPLNFNGAIDLKVTASDGSLSANDTFTLTVTPINDAPVAGADSFATDEDTALVVLVGDLLANDSDIEADALTVASVSNAVNGTVVLVDGQITFTPGSGFFGAAGFSYTLADGNGGVATGSVAVSVVEVPNAPPVFDPQSLSLAAQAGVAATLASMAIDPDQDVLSYSVSGPAKGSASYAGGVLTYTPGVFASGSDLVLITAADGRGGTATQTIDIKITPAPLPAQKFLLVAAAGWQGAIGGNGRIAGTNANEDITLLFGAISLDGSFNRGGDVIRFSGGVEEYVIGRSSASTAILTDNDSVLASIPIGTAGLSIGFADAARRLVFESSEYLLGDQLFGTDSAPVQPQVGDSPLATGNNTTAAGRLVLIGTNVEVTIGGDVLISGTNNVDLITLDASGGTITFDGSFNRGGDIIVLTGAAADYTAVRQGSSSIIIEGEGSKLSIPIGLSGLILRFADGDRTMVFEGGQYLIGNQAITTTPVQLNAVPPSSSIMPSAEAQDMMALEALLMDSVYTPSISPDYLMIA